MEGVVKKWGNSAAVRIPASVLDAAHLELDQSVQGGLSHIRRAAAGDEWHRTPPSPVGFQM